MADSCLVHAAALDDAGTPVASAAEQGTGPEQNMGSDAEAVTGRRRIVADICNHAHAFSLTTGTEHRFRRYGGIRFFRCRPSRGCISA